ncbi:adenosylcobinamide-phosphate synthase CbiB [Bacillus sp. FJAT-44742]|uniref:adenosylcobinamide-phosphate synthase CbiB n=1 Tax=Bacillus sp. FJAT-44742 TaxID=2014005 RepID=UPI000C24A7D4|nr:adenosylcobinamide-phosphate synthase CbiB [Bacillus sp. FJAT-44742]
MMYHLMALTGAVLLDRFLGDPHSKAHPVVVMGTLISFLEKKLNKGTFLKARGGVLLFIVCLCTLGVISAAVVAAYSIHPVVGVLTESVLIWLAIGQRSLEKAAENIAKPLREGNTNEARRQTAMIVSRDTETMQEKDMVRSAVESVGENTSDGVTAPLFYALIGGAPLAYLYRAINTCDAMVGYKTSKYLHFGWAAARADDLANIVPARLTALLMVISAGAGKPLSTFESMKGTMRDAKLHDSPNSGYGEAAIAYILGVTLGGDTMYHGKMVSRPHFGRGTKELAPDRILEAVHIMKKTVAVFILFCWLIGGVVYALA